MFAFWRALIPAHRINGRSTRALRKTQLNRELKNIERWNLEVNPVASRVRFAKRGGCFQGRPRIFRACAYTSEALIEAYQA